MVAIVPEADIPSVQEEPLPGRAYPRVSDEVSTAAFGGSLGRELEGAGNELFGAELGQQAKMNALNERAQRQADQVRIAAANTALNEYVTAQSFEGDNAAYKRHGPNAVNLPQQFLPGFDQHAEQIAEGLTPQQRSAFLVHAGTMRNEWNFQLHRYESAESDRFAHETFTHANDTTITGAGLNWRGMAADPAAYELAKGQVAMTSEAMADRLRIGKKETVDANTDKLIASIVESGLADGGVAQMAPFLEHHKGELTNPATYPVLRDKVDAALKRAEAEELDGLREKYEDAVKGGLAGIPGSELMITREQVHRLFKHDGDAKYAFIAKAAQAGAAEKRYDQMDPAAIQADLDRRNPAAGPAHAGQAQDIELYRVIQEAAQRSVSRRVADGRQFALSTLHQEPIDWNKPDEAAQIIERRFDTQDTDQRRLGVAMPALSKEEARQLNAGLQAAGPEQQLAALTQLRDNLSSEGRFRALIEQIRPDSPVIAAAALRMPQNPNSQPTWYDPRFDNNPTVSRDILTGQALLHPKGALAGEEGKGGFKQGVVMPQETNLRQSFDARFRGLFRSNPTEADQFYETFRALYAAGIAKAGDTSGNINKSVLDQVDTALTPRMDHHFAGPSVPVPYGMDPARFPELARRAARDEVTARGLSPEAFDGHGLLPVGRIGGGRYRVMQDDATAAMDRAGHFIDIDLNRAYQPPGRLTPQRPEDFRVSSDPNDLPAIERPRG